jgi:hypothetical protein
MDVRRLFDVHERLGRLGWLALWLLAKYSLGVWLIEPSTPAATQRHDG